MPNCGGNASGTVATKAAPKVMSGLPGIIVVHFHRQHIVPINEIRGWAA